MNLTQTMENLDITPAFIDIFRRLNKHLDLLPFQKLLNEQNSTLTDEEKVDLKNKINESFKKVRQLNLVLDELKDQILDEIEKVQADYEEKNRDLDALENHLNYVKSNQFNTQLNQQVNVNQIQQTNVNQVQNNQKPIVNKTVVFRERTQEIHNEMNNSNDSFNQSDEDDEIDKELMMLMRNENPNRLVHNQKLESINKHSNLPKKSSLKMPSSNLEPKQNSGSQLNSVIKGINQTKKLSSVDGIKQNNKNLIKIDKLQQQQQQQPKKEKIKNSDNIYINYPQINYISLSEFNYIPNYMRGRMSFETCNKFVDEFNKAVETKYKFMMISNSKYSNEELIKYTLYKNQEDDETKGLFFVTPKDLHELSDLKISMNNTKIFIQCVRHCKRIKEIRGTDKLIRYVILNW